MRYPVPGRKPCCVGGIGHNMGEGIRAPLDIGAQAFGGWSTCHAVQWISVASPLGERVVLDHSRKHSYPLGIGGAAR